MPLRPTYANVTATLALFIALGGTSYAVTKLPANSVGAAQLRKDAVTGVKIQDGSIGLEDLGPAARGARGPRGATGPAGLTGAAGAASPTAGGLISARKDGVTNIPAGAGGSATLAGVLLAPGAWLVEAQTKLVYSQSPAGSEFFDCDLRTATGTVLSRGTVRVGNDPQGTVSDTVPVRAAVNLDVATRVSLICAHQSAIPGGPYAEWSSLQALPVSSITEQQ